MVANQRLTTDSAQSFTDVVLLKRRNIIMTKSIERGSVMRLYIYIYIYIYVCVCVCVCVCVNVHSDICMYLQARMHSHCWCGMFERSV